MNWNFFRRRPEAVKTMEWVIGPAGDEARIRDLEISLKVAEQCRARLEREVIELKAQLRSYRSQKGWNTRRARG